MSAAWICGYDNLDYGRHGGGAQCFEGVCSQDRADVAATGAWPDQPHLTVAEPTRYVAVTLSQPGLLYAGPGPVVEARAAAFPAGWWPVAVEPGHVVAVRDL